LFGVSHVEVRPFAPSIKEFRLGVEVSAATGTKCERCWRYTEDVGRESNYPTVCLRCAEALTASQFPPYTPPEATA
jgi:isoleucyl-tRNA synthetase